MSDFWRFAKAEWRFLVLYLLTCLFLGYFIGRSP